MLCHRALGERLTCIFVDNGLLRLGEPEQVAATFRESFRLNLVAVDARERFLTALRGVTDPEQKRKIIGRVFIEVFEEEARRTGDARWLVQGTLYPDVIESVSFDMWPRSAADCKSYHNRRGLPEKMNSEAICSREAHELFEDEVQRRRRAAPGCCVDLPRRRHQPRLVAVRCLGEVTEKRLAVLRAADDVVTGEIRHGGLVRRR